MDFLIPDVSMPALLQVFAWAMTAMTTGRYPTEDHLGQPWDPESDRARLAGQEFANGQRFAYACTSGDMKWIRETHCLTHHYGTDLLCTALTCFCLRAFRVVPQRLHYAF